MQFPRHNVPQYSGNAVWDAASLDLQTAVAALLGDPFAFAVSPAMDALRHLFLGHRSQELLRSLHQRWGGDERYPAYEMSKWSRDLFLGAMESFTAS